MKEVHIDKMKDINVGIEEPEFNYLFPDIFICYNDRDDSYCNYTVLDLAKIAFPDYMINGKDDIFETIIAVKNTKIKIEIKEINENLLNIKIEDLKTNKIDIQVLGMDCCYTKDIGLTRFLDIMATLFRRLLIKEG